MPLAIVIGKKAVTDHQNITTLVTKIPEIIARYLTCNDLGGSLTTPEVDVKLETFGQHDISEQDLILTIMATGFPSRIANLKERTEQISTALLVTLEDLNFHGISVGVWIVPVKAEWNQFYIPYVDEE